MEVDGPVFAIPRRSWNVKTTCSHPQLRNLLQLSPDGMSLYFVGDADPKSAEHQLSFFLWLGGGSEKVICRLNLRTGEVKKIEKTTLRSIQSFHVEYGFIAFASAQGVYLYHEESDEIIFEDTSGAFSQPNNVRLTRLFDRYLLVLMCNGGYNPLFEIERDRSAPSGYKVSLFQMATSGNKNINFASFGEGDLYGRMIAGADATGHPIFFKVNEDSSLEVDEENVWSFVKDVPEHFRAQEVERDEEEGEPMVDFDCMMAVFGGTRLCAMGLEQGLCVVYDLEKQRVHSIFTNRANTRVNAFAVTGQVRLVTFAPELPVLIYGETLNYFHVVDLKTMKKQIVSPPSPPREKRSDTVRHFIQFLRERAEEEEGAPLRNVGGEPGDADPEEAPEGAGAPQDVEEVTDQQDPAPAEADRPEFPEDDVEDVRIAPRFIDVIDNLARGEQPYAGQVQPQPDQDQVTEPEPEIRVGDIGKADVERDVAVAINGISWRPGTRYFYVCYDHLIQEYYLNYGVNTLKGLASQVVANERPRWEERGWDAAAIQRIDPDLI